MLSVIQAIVVLLINIATAQTPTSEPAATPRQTESPANAASRLATEAVSLAQIYRKRLGSQYLTKIDNQRHIVYVCASDQKTLQHVAKILSEYSDAQRNLFFGHELQWNITVILPTVKDYRQLVRSGKMLGYYRPATRTLTSISLSSILLHEFTHALHHNDQALANQHHPVWITEGLATLFQRCKLNDGNLEPQADFSLLTVQKTVREENAFVLKRICTMNQQTFMQNSEVCYPQVRYLMLFLYRQKKLKAFYESYKSSYDLDPSGSQALEGIFEQGIDQIDTAWRAWVLAQELPWAPAGMHKAHLGIKMENAADGVLITGFLRGSAAERAGHLNSGDVVISLADYPTPTPRVLTQAVQSCQPGQTVDIEVIRQGRTVVVKQILGLMPK